MKVNLCFGFSKILTWLIVDLTLSGIGFVKASEWTYSDASHWSDESPACGGKHQSPINLMASQAQFNQNLDLKETGYDQQYHEKMVSNGHTEQFSMNQDPQEGQPDAVFGDESFHFAQGHFHWAESSDKGSEHTLDEKAFPLELHLVHYNAKYESFKEAATQPDGLLVLGVLFKSEEDSNPKLDPLVKALKDLDGKSDEEQQEGVDVDTFQFSDLIPEQQEFFTYAGSLTTPPCTENVRWVVFRQQEPISEEQMSAFRKLQYGGHPVGPNFRSTQELNDRTVEKNFDSEN